MVELTMVLLSFKRLKDEMTDFLGGGSEDMILREIFQILTP